MKYKVLNYKKLTVNDVRRKYWDKKKKMGKPIQYYLVQTSGDVFVMFENSPGFSFAREPQIFVPDGTLHKVNMKIKKRQIITDWLSLSTSCPYKKTDQRQKG